SGRHAAARDLRLLPQGAAAERKIACPLLPQRRAIAVAAGGPVPLPAPPQLQASQPRQKPGSGSQRAAPVPYTRAAISNTGRRKGMDGISAICLPQRLAAENGPD